MNGADGVLHLTNRDLAWCLILLAAAGAFSIRYRLGLGRMLVAGTLRMTLQLTALAYVLKVLFTLSSPWYVLPVLLFMAGFAVRTGVGRGDEGKMRFFAEGALSILLTCAAVMAFCALIIARWEPWYSPRYLITTTGMVLGNSLTGISLGLERLLDSCRRESKQIESDLALGATPWEAVEPYFRNAVRAGAMPTLNTMLVMGLVWIPGMMTGNLLANAKPLDAMRWQVVIMVLILTALIASLSLFLRLIFRRVYDPAGRPRMKI
jgi:putative ABC transport system permease protein